MKQDKSLGGKGITIVAHGHPRPQPSSKLLKGRVSSVPSAKDKLWQIAVKRACLRALSVVGGRQVMPGLVGAAGVLVRMQFRFGYEDAGKLPYNFGQRGAFNVTGMAGITGIPNWYVDSLVGRKRKSGRAGKMPNDCRPDMPHLIQPDADGLAKVVLNIMVKSGVLPDGNLVASLVIEKVWSKKEFSGVTVQVMPYSRQFDPSPGIGKDGGPCQPTPPIPEWMKGMTEGKI